MSIDGSDISANRGELLRYVSRHVRESALGEDIVQEAYLRYLVYRAKGDVAVGNPLALLRRISLNLARDYFRKAKRFQLEELDDGLASTFDLAKQAEHREMVRIVGGILKAMPSLRRKVFLYRRVDGYSSREVAEFLSLTPGAVDAHVARAVLDLYRAMEKIEKRAAHV